MGQVHDKKKSGSTQGGGGSVPAANPEVTAKGKKLKEDVNNLLDEIDDVLEENAEEFVKNYIQKGGE
ncbi:MAG: ubiquitin-like protein Pup [Patescibacteria group bacterium]